MVIALFKTGKWVVIFAEDIASVLFPVLAVGEFPRKIWNIHLKSMEIIGL
jgi:hypothetical protein